MSVADDARSRMQKTAEALQADLAKIRTGRAHAGLLDAVQVPAYGALSPLPQVASVAVADNRTLLVSPWDPQLAAAIEKAVRESELGVNPAAEGQRIRVNLPQLSEERRRDLVKIVGKEAETARVAARNIRRDAVAEVKKQVKNGDLGEDDGRRLEAEIQKITDDAVGKMDQAAEAKQRELMTV